MDFFAKVCYNEVMRLARNIDQVLGVVTAVSLSIVLAVVANTTWKTTTAAQSDAAADSSMLTGAKFVTFYDDGEKLTVKTEARTVREALERAKIVINEGDVIEPGLDAEIDTDNFFINIHRARPVVVKDGKMTQYLMTASQNIREIAEQAGLTFFDGDEVEMGTNTDFLETGVASVYKIIRNGGRKITVEEEIVPGERVEKDYNLAPGERKVLELGEVGVKTLTYEVKYVDNQEVSRELLNEEITKAPKERVVAIGASRIEMYPLTPGRGAQRYTYTKSDGTTVMRKETFYDLDMHRVMQNCGGGGYYTVREDGVKVDKDGRVVIAANLNTYPRCSVVETSLGEAKVYDTGGFAVTAEGPEWFDIATDWTNRNGI